MIRDPLTVADPSPTTAPCPTCRGTGRILSDEEIGARIRARRLEKGWTLAALAAAATLTRPYLNDLELGKRRWQPEPLRRCLAALEQTTPTPG
jgi:hypothetical protein